jgi:hypothetical protein
MNDQEPMAEERSGPSVQTFITAAFLVCALVAGILAYYLVGTGTNPERECVYRGGSWIEESGCIFESADGTTQVGMKLPTLMLRLPDEAGEVHFTDIEIGSSAGEHSANFDQGGGLPEGSVALLQEFARVEKSTGDLVVPFAVTYGGTGVFTYLAIFEKTLDGYFHRDSLIVGDRIGLESLSLSVPQDAVYTAKLLYRDREAGQAMADVPRDPRTLGAIVFDHQFDRHFVTSRDGLLYKDVLKVKEPVFNQSVASPLVISGEARGWYFEASFPVELVDWDGRIIAQGPAQAQGDWMTSEFVPFKATLSFTVPDDIPYRRATLILRKDNPSGMPENDDAFEIPVLLK